MEAMDSISGEPLCFIGVVIISLILPVLGIMAHNTSRKLKLVNREVIVSLFNYCTATALCSWT